MKPACKDCRYWAIEPKEPFGFCHRFPPPNRDGEFPVMGAQEWCGEFVPEEPGKLVDWPEKDAVQK